MKELTLKVIQKNPCVLEFLNQTDACLKVHNYTDHGLRHAKLVATRARTVDREIGLPKRSQELSAIAGITNDFANFLSRTIQTYLGALILHQNIKWSFPTLSRQSLF
jgi:metal-dependent HD superfamily phosphatase/phosphodiesterase